MWLKTHWKDIAAALGVMLLIQKFMSETLGVTMIGKKIYKGAPLVWRWIMQGAIHRKELTDKLDLIVHEVQYNNETSLKDAVARIEVRGKENHELLKSIVGQVNYNTLRLNLYDKRANLMTFEMDSSGSVTLISDAFLRKFGVREDDVLGFGFENLIHEDDVQRVRDKWQRCCEKCSRFSDIQKIILHSGDFIEVAVEGYPIAEDGECIGFYGTIEILNTISNNKHI